MDHDVPVIGYQPGSGGRRLHVPAWLIVMLVLAGWLGLGVLGGRLTRFPRATPKQIADAQAAFDRTDRARGQPFTELVRLLDENGRGLLTEQELVQRLGTPDGQIASRGSTVLAYNYDGSGTRDQGAFAEFSGGVLVSFGYTSTSDYPPLRLQPYVPPPAATRPTAAPATAPGGDRP